MYFGFYVSDDTRMKENQFVYFEILVFTLTLALFYDTSRSSSNLLVGFVFCSTTDHSLTFVLLIGKPRVEGGNAIKRETVECGEGLL